MKIAKTFLTGVVAAAAVAPAWAGPAAAGLRQVLQQYHSVASPPPPRQLSPEERAELRRQLAESARRASAEHDAQADRLPLKKKRTPAP